VLVAIDYAWERQAPSSIDDDLRALFRDRFGYHLKPAAPDSDIQILRLFSRTHYTYVIYKQV
jgi:hypothetical protein